MTDLQREPAAEAAGGSTTASGSTTAGGSTTASGSTLEAINRQLAAILRTEPASLAQGADAALEDELVICGILGGKDVGKSTLISALAQATASGSTAASGSTKDPTRLGAGTEEVGRGTEGVVAYVHEGARDAVAQRLQPIQRVSSLEIVAHRADSIRNVVLVDLPDFDSEFSNHRAVVRAVAPLLDRILWVVTPRKIGDRAWVRMFHDVVKDTENIHCVLNKVDELLTDSEPFAAPNAGACADDGRGAEGFWARQHRWVADWIDSVGCPTSQQHPGAQRRPGSHEHRFLVAAGYPQTDSFVDRIALLWDDPDWTRYADDRPIVVEVARLAAAELDRLRACVLSPVSADQGRAIKAANRRREGQVNVTRIKRHYDLDRAVARLAHACDPDYHRQVVQEAFGCEYGSTVAASVTARFRPDRSLADELLERRVGDWPLLRLVHWPFGWLSRAMGARGADLASQPAGPVGSVPGWKSSSDRLRSPSHTRSTDPFDGSGLPLEDRIESLRSRILADHAAVARQLDLERELPASSQLAHRVTSTVAALPARFEARLLEELRQRDRRRSPIASWIGKAALWFVFLWFPFVQPIFAGTLEVFGEDGAWNLAHGLYRIVSALSAAHLLAGFAVVGAVFVALIAGMYARALRAIRRLRSDEDEAFSLAEAIDRIVVDEVVVPLSASFRHRLDRLAPLIVRLEQPAFTLESRDHTDQRHAAKQHR